VTEIRRVEVIVEGRVQGVGFRDFCVRSAERLGVVGYAANLDNGCVRVVAEGRGEALEAFVREIERGPRLARVEHARASWQAPLGEFSRFDVRRVGRDA
jgi:acylphosphatase